MEENRPDPQVLLQRIKREEEKTGKKRGKLKIFVGFAAGVGKTYSMLDAAHTAMENGIDVVAGYIEPHARAETLAMQEGLEMLEPQMVEYKGIMLREFDLDAALKRRPQLLLVDELAHTNAKGLRHEKRYQDIEELLEAGINVYTTVNIQHLESLNDVVGNITNIHVKERIPDRVFDEADQIEVIDIEPDELIQRLKEGKIYKKGQAERALDNFFAREKLIALREIALRRAADRVNRLAEMERERNGKQEYYTGEHILTCLSPSPSCAKVIRSASRLAYAFHAKFTAIYVETPALQSADAKTKKMVEENVKLAKALGAQIATVFGEDVSYQIATYAKVSNVSKIVIGRTNHRIMFGQTKGTLSERISLIAPNVDIYIIPDFNTTMNRWKNYLVRKRNFEITPSPQKFSNIVKTMGVLVACTMVGFIFKRFDLAESNIIMVYLLGVIALSIFTNKRLYSAAASILSVLLFNFFFTEPKFSMEAYDKGYPVTFVIMFVVAFITSSLVSQVQRHAKMNAKHAYRTDILLENSKKMNRADSSKEVLKEVAAQILKLMNLSIIIYVESKEKMVGPFLFPRRGMEKTELAKLANKEERTVAQWVLKNGKRAGACTHTLPNANVMYLPVKNDDKVFAVCGIYLEERREIPTFEYGLIIAMLNEAALSLDRFFKE